MNNKKPSDLQTERRHSNGIVHGWLMWYLRRSQRHAKRSTAGELAITPGSS
jgi:hypothetical protein